MVCAKLASSLKFDASSFALYFKGNANTTTNHVRN
jgi:hypothetical protein